MKRWSKTIAIAAASTCALLSGTLACAQDYLNRSITLVVPFAAAGISDNQSRCWLANWPIASDSRWSSRTGRAPAA